MAKDFDFGDTIVIRLELNVKQAAVVALNAKLFVQKPGWGLRRLLTRLADQNVASLDKYVVSMAYEGETPIGICVTTIDETAEVQVYVKPKYRRYGIGTRLCEVVKILIPKSKKIEAGLGVPGSKCFFQHSVRVDLLFKHV